MLVLVGNVSFLYEKWFIDFEITSNDYKMPLLLVVSANLQQKSVKLETQCLLKKSDCMVSSIIEGKKKRKKLKAAKTNQSSFSALSQSCAAALTTLFSTAHNGQEGGKGNIAII